MMEYVGLVAMLLGPALLAIWFARRDRSELRWPKSHTRNVVGGGDENPALLPVELLRAEVINGAEVDDVTRRGAREANAS